MILQIVVKPNARHSLLEPLPDGTWRAQVKAPPIDGRANAELTSLIADHFGCPKAAVTIQQGSRGRRKRVYVAL